MLKLISNGICVLLNEYTWMCGMLCNVSDQKHLTRPYPTAFYNNTEINWISSRKFTEVKEQDSNWFINNTNIKHSNDKCVPSCFRYVCDEMTVKPESIATDQSSLDLAWTKLLENSIPNAGQVTIKMNDDETTHVVPNTTTNPPVGMKKSSSWMGSFHNQIRSSIKAVTESPGPITR